MAVSEGLVPDLAGAVLDGTPIDWAAAESSADEANRPLLARAQSARHSRRPSPSSPASPGSCDAHRRRGSWRKAGTLGTPARARADRLRRIRRGVSGLGHAARSGGGAQAAARGSSGRRRVRRRPSSRKAGCSPACVIRTSSRSTAPSKSEDGSVSGWNSFGAARSSRSSTMAKCSAGRKLLQIGVELCQAVAAVHDEGLLHRDIKAQNVMLAENGRAMLMDFGTGRELADNSTSDLAGTPLYLAPEILGGREATVQSDIYSLGVLLYYLVTGSYPVRARSLRDIRLAHERNERTSIRPARARPDLSPKLARIIERAIDPRPERRYQSADAFAADLAALRPRPTLVRRTYAMGVAAALILGLGLGWEVLGRHVGSYKDANRTAWACRGLDPCRRFERQCCRTACHCGASVQESQQRSGQRGVRRRADRRNPSKPRRH